MEFNLTQSLIKYVLFDYLDLNDAIKILPLFEFLNDESIWKKKADQYKLKDNNNNNTTNLTTNHFWLNLCKKKLKIICKFCIINDGYPNEFFSMYLCNICKKLDKFQLICKTRAKSKYFLNEADLFKLKYINEENPYYKGSSPMILFSENDIENVFISKHNIKPDDIKNKLKELENKKLMRSQKKIKLSPQNFKPIRI